MMPKTCKELAADHDQYDWLTSQVDTHVLQIGHQAFKLPTKRAKPRCLNEMPYLWCSETNIVAPTAEKGKLLASISL